MSLTRVPTTKEITVARLTLAQPENGGDTSPEADRAADEALYMSFLDARARARGPMACVNSRLMAWNAAAVRLVMRDDREELWTWARHAIDADDRSVHCLRLRGLDLSARCEGVFVGFEAVGAVIRFGARARRKPHGAAGARSVTDGPSVGRACASPSSA